MISKSRRLDKDEFKLIFDIFVTLQLPSTQDPPSPYWDSNKTLLRLVKEEAEDVLIPFVRDYHDKKVKREIFKRHYEKSKKAYADKYANYGWEQACLAIQNGYEFFYGSDWVNLFKSHTKPVTEMVVDNNYFSLSNMLDQHPEDKTEGYEGVDNEMMYDLFLTAAYEDFLQKGYIKI